LKAQASTAAERLVIEAAKKDPGRFAELYEDNFERVYAFIARRVYDREQAQDLTADVFHQALASLPRFEWRGIPFAAWLYRIAANAIADHSKQSTRAKRNIQIDNASGDCDFAGTAQSSDSAFEEVEHRARLFKLVDRLPADQRRVIIMRFAQEKTIAEIAAELKKSEGAIKQLQFRALTNMRAKIGTPKRVKNNG